MTYRILATFNHADDDEETVGLVSWANGEVTVTTGDDCPVLSRDDVARLRDWLNQHLEATKP